MMTVFVIASFVIVLVAAPVVVLLIRRSVRRYMRRRAQEMAPDTETKTAEPRYGAAPLRIETVKAARSVPASEAGQVFFRRTESARNTTVAIYLLAAVVCALVYAGGDCVGAADVLTIRCFLTLLPLYAWPVALTAFAVAAAPPRQRLLGLLLAFLVSYGIVTAVRGNALVWPAFVGAPTVILAFVSNSRMKTTAPFITGMAMLVLLVFPVTIVLDRVNEKAAVFFLFIVAPALLVAIPTIFIDAYRRKKFSDLWFQVAFLWGTFAVCYVMFRVEPDFKPEKPWWWVWGPAVLMLQVIVTLALLPRLRREARRHPPIPLLVLRVFGASSRAQRLFEKLGTRWRYIGPIQLIAGLDSVIANLNFDEVARYLTFRFRSLFVKSSDDLEKRLAGLDLNSDPDGRYRINNFFCFDDLWRPTVSELLNRPQAVLVDLGGFDEDNKGVAFELGQLLACRPLDTFVLTTDEQTKTELLHDLLTYLWSNLAPGSPNARLTEPVMRILHRPTSAGLVAALCDAAVAASAINAESPRGLRRDRPEV